MNRSNARRVGSIRRRLLAEKLETRHLLAGPYAPAADEAGSTAISKDDVTIESWASAVVSYTPGLEVDVDFQDSQKAVGPAEGTSSDAVSLGRGGTITLSFDLPIRDGLGFDFAVFENSFSDTFLELGYVEVSSDGVNFFGFETASLTPSSVDAFGSVDPTDLNNLAGKYRQGFGTPFDLEEIRGISPLLDTTRVSHLRITDIVGDGNDLDSDNRPIYDPYATVGSAGFDLDAIGVLHQLEVERDIVDFEDVGASLSPQSGFAGPDPEGTSVEGPFEDTVVLGDFQSERLSFNNAYSVDFGSWNQWAYSNSTDNTTAGFTNQFGVIPGVGGNETASFGVGFANQGTFYDQPTISKAADDARQFSSLLITNTTYAALSMRDGDSFAKKFGGDSGNDEDYYRLMITGVDGSDAPIDTIEFLLADYRFANNSLDYIVDQWVEIDLTPIADAKRLVFTVESSDNGPFGMNTPAYFAVDEITLETPVLPLDIADRKVSEADGENATTARVSRASQDSDSAIEVDIAAVDSTIASVPAMVTIPAGAPYVEFPIGVVNNSVFDGVRSIVVAATADGFLGNEQSLFVEDDEQRTLTLALDSPTLVEGGSLNATVERNDADVTESLVVQVSSSDDSLFAFPSTVTIEPGMSTAVFSIAASEDDIDREDGLFDFSVVSDGYLNGVDSVNWIDNDLPQLTLTTESLLVSEDVASPVAGMEDTGRSLAPKSFNNGADFAGGFTSSGLLFNNDYDPTFGSWSGWSFSNTTDTTTAGFLNQYSAFAGEGASGSDTYAVASAYGFPSLPSIRRDAVASTAFHSIEVTNTTYAALSMLQGDSFAKQFGGPSGDDPDWLMLTIEGLDEGQNPLGTIDFYLADYRFSNNSLDYIVDQWTTLSLEPLADAVELRFSMSSSDVGDFGMNTPAYFAVDNVTTQATMQSTLVVSRNTFDRTGDVEVSLISSDTSELRVPSRVVIPDGSASVEVPVIGVADRLVDGTQDAQVTASAMGFPNSSITFSVMDVDEAELTLSFEVPQVVESSGSVQAVIHRNVEDLSQALDVVLLADPEGDLVIPESIVIPAGARSIGVSFSVVDNEVVDGDRVVAVTASADTFQSGSESVSIIDDELALRIDLDSSTISESDSAPTAMLEEIGATLASESYYNGADGAGGFTSGVVDFNNAYDPTFGSWGGWSVSNSTDRTTPGYQNQFAAFTGTGALGSPTYAVASAFPGGTAPTLTIDEADAVIGFDSILVTNTTYAALSMTDGDSFAKKFGGQSGDDPDFFLLTIEGFDDDGESAGQVEFYLADFRFADNSLDYIVDEWTRVDVSSLGDAKRLEFSLSSSDVGMFGMNTPAYFAVDQVVTAPVTREFITATLYRDQDDTADPLVVSLENSDQSEASVPAFVTIPAGSASVSFEIVAVDDAIVDGTQIVDISASGGSYISATTSVSVEDDDTSRLTATVVGAAVNEASSAVVVVHRNSGDLDQDLVIALSVDRGEVVLPLEAVIPSGAASSTIVMSVTDNEFRDGDRMATVMADAEGFLDDSDQFSIIDDEQSGLVISESDGSTIVSELAGEDAIEVSLLSRPQTNVVVEVSAETEDFDWSPILLTFTPDDWDQPQLVAVRGVPDMQIEGEEEIPLSLAVVASLSDALFADVPPSNVTVTVLDENPDRLRIGESGGEVFLVDEESGVELLANAVEDGIDVVTNSLSQTLVVDALVETSGLVRVDMLGGDDQVILRGERFSTLDGGAGFDTLVLALDVPVELGSFLDQRTARFEQYVLASESGAELTIDSASLSYVTTSDEAILLRIESDQTWSFSADAVLLDPVMYGDEFAHVIELGGVQVTLISPTPWQNSRSPWDVNGSGDVTSLDALTVINELARREVAELPDIDSLDDFSGDYYDVSGDGLISALDALRVINEMARQDLGAEPELVNPEFPLRTVAKQFELAVETQRPDGREDETLLERTAQSWLDGTFRDEFFRGDIMVDASAPQDVLPLTSANAELAEGSRLDQESLDELFSELASGTNQA